MRRRCVILLLSLFEFQILTEASNVALCTADGAFHGYLKSANTPDYTSNPNNLINPSSLPTGDSRYWKCVDTTIPADGIMDAVVEMSVAEKTAIDAPVLAEAAKQAAFDTEVASNDLCTAELSDITSRVDTVKASLDTDIGAVSNIATAKTALSNMNTAYATALRKIAKCIRARAR